MTDKEHPIDSLPDGPLYGGLARVYALIAGVEDWWKVTQWPIEADAEQEDK